MDKGGISAETSNVGINHLLDLSPSNTHTYTGADSGSDLGVESQDTVDLPPPPPQFDLTKGQTTLNQGSL